MKFFFQAGVRRVLGTIPVTENYIKVKAAFYTSTKTKEVEHPSMVGRGGGSYIFIYAQNKSKLGTFTLILIT
jgi:hypothetical protein